MPTRPAWRSIGSLTALTAALLVVGALLCMPYSEGDSGRELRVVVLDTSASVGRVRRNLAAHYAAQIQNQAAIARRADEDLCLVRLDREVRVLLPPTRARDLGADPFEGPLSTWQPDASRDGETEWAKLFDVVEELFREAGRGELAPGSLWVTSDGVAQSDSQWHPLWKLANSGIEVGYLPLPDLNGRDVALVELHVPPRIPTGSASMVQLVCAWRGRGCGDLPGARVEITLSGQSEQLEPIVMPLRLPAATDPSPTDSGLWKETILSIPLPPLETGWFGVEARVRVPGDRASENDALRSSIVVGDPALVLAVGPQESIEPWLQAWSQGGGRDLAVRWVTPDELVGSLHQAQVLWTVDTPVVDLPGVLVEEFVSLGGSWLFQGELDLLPGWGSVPAPGVHDLAPMLPLEVDYGDGPERDVVLMVDGSGSMQGEGWAQVKRATEILLSGLPLQDGFALHMFTSDVLPASLKFPGAQEVTDRVREQRDRARRNLLRAKVPGGPTDILNSLDSFRKQRVNDRSCLVVLITDGKETEPGSMHPAEVRQDLAEMGVRIAAVASGLSPNTTFLNFLLNDDDALVLGGDLAALGRLLQEEILGEALRREPGMQVERVSEQINDGFGQLTLPEPAYVRSYLRTELRDGARAVWRSNLDEPLLATLATDLGMVAGLPSMAGADFLQVEPGLLQSILTQLAGRALARTSDRPELVRVQSGVQLHGSSGLDAEVWVQTGDDPWRELETRPLEPRFGLDPRTHSWVAREGLPAGKVDRAELRFPGQQRDQKKESAPLVWPYQCSPEFLPQGPNWPIPAPKRGSRVAPKRLGPHPAGPWFLGGALVGLLVLIYIHGQGVKEMPFPADGP